MKKTTNQISYNMENTMNFGDAIAAIKEGKKVARIGWNGKGMFIFLNEGKMIYPNMLRNPSIETPVEKIVNDREKGMEALPFIIMKTADDKFCPGWLASQTDMLSEDWIIVK